jgi:hypothetical protein
MKMIDKKQEWKGVWEKTNKPYITAINKSFRLKRSGCLELKQMFPPNACPPLFVLIIRATETIAVHVIAGCFIEGFELYPSSISDIPIAICSQMKY